MKSMRDRRAKIGVVVVAALVGAMAGCVYTLRPNWWNFYERGLSQASKGQTEAAAEDFETAAGTRKGATLPRPEDARRVRTYGLHFIDDYFPHRELGIAYYRMKRFADAERELLISMDQTPSAKAKSYLNLVRGEILRQKPAQDEPPTLELKFPSGSYVNSRKIVLEGVAQSKNYVSSVIVNGERLFTELAEQKMSFSKEVSPRPGANEFVVEAIDLVGKSAQKKLVVNLDTQYPAVAIEDVVRKDAKTIAVSGIATDNAGVSSLVVRGGRKTVAPPTREVEFSVDAIVGETFTVEVTDVAGNRTSARLTIAEDMLSPGGEGLSRPLLLAMAGFDRIVDSGGMGLRLCQNAAVGETSPPVIVLTGVEDGRVIYGEELIFDGMVRDNDRLAAVSVNGEDMLGERTGVLVKYFTYRANLKEGVNPFRVVAVDKAGHRAEKSFQVIRKIQKPLEVEARLTLALLPLQENGPTRSATGQVYDLLLGSFIGCGRFNFVEREPAAFASVLTELKIGNSELADKATAVRIGRMKTAEGMLYGKTIEDEKSITVDLWLVDTETSEILFFADVYGEDKSRDELKWLVDGLVLKYRQRFPLVRGKVTGVTDAGVHIDNGSLDGIWAGMKYLILREDEKGVSGALTILKLNGKSLEGRVNAVQQQSCFAALPDKSGISMVKVNDPVITK